MEGRPRVVSVNASRLVVETGGEPLTDLSVQGKVYFFHPVKKGGTAKLNSFRPFIWMKGVFYLVLEIHSW